MGVAPMSHAENPGTALSEGMGPPNCPDPLVSGPQGKRQPLTGGPRLRRVGAAGPTPQAICGHWQPEAVGWSDSPRETGGGSGSQLSWEGPGFLHLAHSLPRGPCMGWCCARHYWLSQRPPSHSAPNSLGAEPTTYWGQGGTGQPQSVPAPPEEPSHLLSLPSPPLLSGLCGVGGPQESRALRGFWNCPQPWLWACPRGWRPEEEDLLGSPSSRLRPPSLPASGAQP